MRKVTVPEPIQVIDPSSRSPLKAVTFRDFIVSLLADKRFGASPATLASCATIYGAVDTCTPGDEVTLHPNDYELLLAAMDSPTNEYNPAIAMWLIPFMDAVRRART